MTNQLPNEFYKKAVRDVCTMFEASEGDVDREFYQYLVKKYQQCRERLSRVSKGDDGLNSETGEAASEVFVFAAGLFAYGHKDVALDILNNIPQAGHIRRLASVVTSLLPESHNFDALEHTDQLKSWLHENISALRWNESTGRYTFD